MRHLQGDSLQRELFIPLMASLPGRERAGGGLWEVSVLESVAALAEYQA